MKYLIQDGDKVKKATMEGLEEVEGELNEELFKAHGTDYLSDIIGEYDKEVDMDYKGDLGDKKLYGYKLVGFKNISNLDVIRNG